MQLYKTMNSSMAWEPMGNPTVDAPRQVTMDRKLENLVSTSVSWRKKNLEDFRYCIGSHRKIMDNYGFCW